MASSSGSACQTLSPLLTLPVELKELIISYLCDDHYPSLVCLRRTHSSFITVIPKAQIRSNLSRADLLQQFLVTERLFPDLLPRDHYPCYVCARVLPLSVFPFTLEHHFDNEENPSYCWPRCCDGCPGRWAFCRVSHVDETLSPGTIAPSTTPRDRSSF